MPAPNVTPPPGQGAGVRASQGRKGAARSPSGTISVVTTEQGLPVALKIDPRELKKSPQQLANEVLALCRLSGMRAQVAHRREMEAQGVDSSTIEIMGLATDSDVVNAEEGIFGDGDLPDSWMRSV